MLAGCQSEALSSYEPSSCTSQSQSKKSAEIRKFMKISKEILKNDPNCKEEEKFQKILKAYHKLSTSVNI